MNAMKAKTNFEMVKSGRERESERKRERGRGERRREGLDREKNVIQGTQEAFSHSALCISHEGLTEH